MGKDFAPCHHVLAHRMWLNEEKESPYLSNLIIRTNGKEEMMYTDEEIKDRKNHEAMAVMCSDIYITLREKLSTKEFEELNAVLTKLMKSYMNGESIDNYPEPILTWFFNKHNHHYHEPNDEEFVEYVLKKKGRKNE